LTALEAAEIESTKSAPEAPPAAQSAPPKPSKAPRRWPWRYHYYLPQDEYWPLDPAKPDGPSIHAIFFDSAFIVRAAENCGERKLTCAAAVPTDENAPEDPLACARAQAALCRLKEELDSEKHRPGVTWRIFMAHHPFWTVGEHGGYDWSAVDGEAAWSNQCSKGVDPQGWFKNTQFDPEDECSTGWQWYLNQIKALMKDRKPFDLALMGHDHSLQLIVPGEKDDAALAKLQIVSGAGCESTLVRGPGPRTHPAPSLERVYTAATTRQGVSRTGFVALRFYSDRIHVQFFDGWRALPAVSMAPRDEAKSWEGKSCFVVREGGVLDTGAECRW
jgi:hypothetical protein